MKMTAANKINEPEDNDNDGIYSELSDDLQDSDMEGKMNL